MSSDSLFELNNVQKSYGGRVVFDAPRLCFERGARYAFIGANGSGKSTLLRLLAGVIEPTQGVITRHGLDNSGDVAYLPQHPYTFSFSVLRNMTIAIQDGSEAEKLANARHILQEVGIDELETSLGSRLSGGEGQRLSVARLLVQKHKLLLLDEPTSATDIAGNELIEQAVTRYLHESDADLIFATHALSQAERMADNILFFSGGRVVESGPPQQLLYAPQTKACTAFLRFWQSGCSK